MKCFKVGRNSHFFEANKVDVIYHFTRIIGKDANIFDLKMNTHRMSRAEGEREEAILPIKDFILRVDCLFVSERHIKID